MIVDVIPEIIKLTRSIIVFTNIIPQTRTSSSQLRKLNHNHSHEKNKTWGLIFGYGSLILVLKQPWFPWIMGHHGCWSSDHQTIAGGRCWHAGGHHFAEQRLRLGLGRWRLRAFQQLAAWWGWYGMVSRAIQGNTPDTHRLLNFYIGPLGFLRGFYFLFWRWISLMDNVRWTWMKCSAGW